MTPSEEIFGEYASVGLLALKVLAGVRLVTVLVW